MSGRPVETFTDWMRQSEKRAFEEMRRPSVTKASDILGPGIAPTAVKIPDWNGEATMFNGFFYSSPGALNSPDPTMHWIGESLATPDGYGFQRVMNYRFGDNPPSTMVRTFTSPGGTRMFTPWVPPGRTPYAALSTTTTPNVADVTWETRTGWSSMDPTNWGYHSSISVSGGAWTLEQVGLYLIVGVVAFDAGGTGRRVMRIFKNASTTVFTGEPSVVGGGGRTSMPFNAILPFAAGDSFEIQGWQNSGGNLAWYGADEGSNTLGIWRLPV